MSGLDVRLAAVTSRRAMLGILGVAASAAGAVLLGAAAPVWAQDAQPKPDMPPPKRRSIAPPPAEPSAPAASSRGRATKDGDGETLPGGLPGSAPSPDWGGSKRDSSPGGLPGARP